MQTKAPSPPHPAGVGTDERLPVLPKVHIPLKASLQDTPPHRSFACSLQDGVHKWFQKKKPEPEPATSKPPAEPMQEKAELRKHRSASRILLGVTPMELPLLDTTNDLCPRCHGFLKHEAIPCLPDEWTEIKLNSGRTGFLNTKTNEMLAIPPPGMPPTSGVVFQYHGTTSHVCRCRRRHGSLVSPPRKSRRYSASAEVAPIGHSIVLATMNASPVQDTPPMERQKSNLT